MDINSSSKAKVSAGDKFGKLTVVGLAEKLNSRIMWNCICDCGTKVTVRQCGLYYGGTKSCGCKSKEGKNKRHFVHGMSRTKTHRVWTHMRQRCENPNDKKYKNYGGRGISVCNRWSSFENFLADMGKAPDDMSIERINNNGNYEPSNCRWATPKEQANNTRRNRLISWNGTTDTISGWANRLNVSREVLNVRIKRGWSMDRATTQPVRSW